MNRKKIQRLWREECLRVPQRKRKRQRLGESTGPAGRLRAERPNHVGRWTSGSTPPATAARLKLLPVVDEYTREALAPARARVTVKEVITTHISTTTAAVGTQ